MLLAQIISGQQLPKPKASGAKGNTVDPYVTIEVFGIPADCVEERTKTVQHSSECIIYNFHHRFSFIHFLVCYSIYLLLIFLDTF